MYLLMNVHVLVIAGNICYFVLTAAVIYCYLHSSSVICCCLLGICSAESRAAIKLSGTGITYTVGHKCYPHYSTHNFVKYWLIFKMRAENLQCSSP